MSRFLLQAINLEVCLCLSPHRRCMLVKAGSGLHWTGREQRHDATCRLLWLAGDMHDCLTARAGDKQSNLVGPSRPPNAVMSCFVGQEPGDAAQIKAFAKSKGASSLLQAKMCDDPCLCQNVSATEAKFSVDRCDRTAPTAMQVPTSSCSTKWMSMVTPPRRCGST